MWACDECALTPGLNEDYVICRTCTFTQMQDQILHCPDSYGKLFVINTLLDGVKNKNLENLIYNECKKTM